LFSATKSLGHRGSGHGLTQGDTAVIGGDQTVGVDFEALTFESAHQTGQQDRVLKDTTAQDRSI
jgi:hypothetical protein